VLQAAGTDAQSQDATNTANKTAVRTPGAATGSGGVTASSPRELPPDMGVARSPAKKHKHLHNAEQTADGLNLMQMAALDRVNYHRRLAGLDPVAPDPRLLKVAQAHSAYLDSMNQISHYESDKSNPYYTGNSPFNRIDASGYKYLEAGEVIARQSSIHPPAAVDALMAAIYHRFIILMGNVTQAGPGVMLKAHQGTEELSVTVDFGAETMPPTAPPTRLTVYPVNGHQAVPIDFGPAQEEPNPMPGQTLTGYPISLQVDPRQTLTVTTFEVHELTDNGAGPSLDARLLANRVDTNTPQHAAALIPTAPLKFAITYEASFTGAVNGTPVSLAWHFTTAAAMPITMTFDAPSVALGATQRISLNGLDEEKGPYYVCYTPARLVKQVTHETESAFLMTTGGQCDADRPCQITVLATYHSACNAPFAQGTFSITQ
jgi:uncharacterized protein YkwD